MLVAIAFAVLVLATLALSGARFFARDANAWLVDGSGLLVQGLIAAALAALPVARGPLDVPFFVAFLIAFVGVDYAYYWNHRLLHGALWRWHAVHHSASRLDVLVTSRNTLATPLLIVYLWSGLAALLVLRDASGFLLGMSLTAVLDLWRHSPLVPPPRVRRALAWLLVTPHEHAWHHSSERTEVNFGANFTIWDRLHGTYLDADELPAKLGVDVPVTLLLPERR